MTTAKIVISNETNCKITGLELSTRKRLTNKFKYEIPGARFTPAVRLGRWDGTKTFCQLGGSTYINLLPEILPLLDEEGYYVELEDLREYNNSFDLGQVQEDSYSHICWPKGHTLEGQPIMLRDYQVDAINTFLGNTQSIQCLATGAGKCLDGNTKITLEINEFNEFGKFLLNTLQQEAASDVTSLPTDTERDGTTKLDNDVPTKETRSVGTDENGE